MAAKKFRKIIPAHAITALDKYLEQVSAFINYVDTVKDNIDMPDQVKKTLSDQITELKSYDQ